MSSNWKFLIGVSLIILLGSIAGGFCSLLFDPGWIRNLTSFLIGGIIGIVGWGLTEIWTDETEGKV